MKLIETKNLNQAALLLTLGAKFVRLYDTYPRCVFVLSVHPWQLWYEKHIGLVPYKKFCGNRMVLKTKGRARAGRGSEFAGKQDGFLFTDVARIVPWNKRDQQKL